MVTVQLIIGIGDVGINRSDGGDDGLYNSTQHSTNSFLPPCLSTDDVLFLINRGGVVVREIQHNARQSPSFLLPSLLLTDVLFLITVTLVGWLA